jgi:uncharacterized membrane protein
MFTHNKLIGQLTQMLISSLMLCARCFFTFVALVMIVLQIGVHWFTKYQMVDKIVKLWMSSLLNYSLIFT